MVSKTTTVSRRVSPPSFGSANPGPGSEKLSRTGYSTVSIQNELYERIRKTHIPGRAKSIQAYVTFWTRVGTIIDEGIDDGKSGAELLAVVLNSLNDL